jgi:hypothetical protein
VANIAPLLLRWLLVHLFRSHFSVNLRPSLTRYSDRYARFWDTVAGLLAEQHPANPPVVTGYAYDNYESPPVNYTIKNNNVMVGVVAFDSFPPSANSTANGRASWEGWRAQGASRMFWRPNVPPTFGVGPYQYSTSMVSTVRWLAPRGLRAMDVDSLFGHWALSGFTYFVTSRAMWDPSSVDHDTELKRFCTAAFPPPGAVDACQRYVLFWEKWTNSTAGSLVDDRSAAFAYNDTVLSAAAAILAEVSGNCSSGVISSNSQRDVNGGGSGFGGGGGGGCLSRAAFWSDGLEHARLTAAAVKSVNASVPCASDHACDVHNDSLQDSLALLAFRRRVALTSPVNVLATTVCCGCGHTHTHTHTHVHFTGSHACAHAHTHTHRERETHTHTHVNTPTHTHTHTRAHARAGERG